MELSVDRAVDDPGLESGISIAKAYCGRHVDTVRGDGLSVSERRNR